MTQRCKAVALAGATVIGSMMSVLTSSLARADDLTLAPQYQTYSQPKYIDEATTAPATAPAAPDRPLAAALKKAGINTGDIAIYGFAEGSWTSSFSNPPNNFIAGRVFDIDNEEIILNQLDLSIEKTVDAAAAAKDGKWNIGGKVEVIYGNDARFIHSNGLNFYGSASPQLDPENQFDLTQAYVDIGVPVGTGLLVRAGKFVTLLGQETINPTTNAFYSHSYLFGYAIPFTHTGVTGTYSLSDKLTVTGGIVRGWDQALTDNNDAVSFIGQVKYVFNDKVTGYVNVITGPEQNNNDSNYRSVVDGILAYTVNDKLTLTANGDFGWEPDSGSSGQDAMWYGIAGYAGYKLCDAALANVRLEWFNDEQGARGIGDIVYEASFGVAIKPFYKDSLGQNLTIRPELRYDYAENAYFDGGTQHDQWTVAIDAIFTY